MIDTEVFEKPEELKTEEPIEVEAPIEEIKEEVKEEVKEEAPKRKKGKHKKPMSDERRKQLRENLRKGRETSLKNRKAKKESKKLEKAKIVVKKNEGKLEIRIRELEEQLQQKNKIKEDHIKVKPIEKTAPINIIRTPKVPELKYYRSYNKRSLW